MGWFIRSNVNPMEHQSRAVAQPWGPNQIHSQHGGLSLFCASPGAWTSKHRIPSWNLLNCGLIVRGVVCLLDLLFIDRTLVWDGPVWILLVPTPIKAFQRHEGQCQNQQEDDLQNHVNTGTSGTGIIVGTVLLFQRRSSGFGRNLACHSPVGNLRRAQSRL